MGCPEGGFVVVPNTYCYLTVCDVETDTAHCCERGIKFYYYKFTTTRLYENGQGMIVIQLAEFYMWFHDIPIQDFSKMEPYTINGDSPLIEQPSQAFDNNPNTKWLDYKTSALLMKFEEPVVIDRYGFMTANDIPFRDPVDWRMEASYDGTTWVRLAEEKTAPGVVPIERFTKTQRFGIQVPCVNPLNVENAPINASCEEGPAIEQDANCTAKCDEGYIPSVASLYCNSSEEVVWTPETFTCFPG